MVYDSRFSHCLVELCQGVGFSSRVSGVGLRVEGIHDVRLGVELVEHFRSHVLRGARQRAREPGLDGRRERVEINLDKCGGLENCQTQRAVQREPGR